MSRYDIVTFDMGYTLVHFYPSENALYLDAFREVGLAPDPGALQQAREEVWREAFAESATEIYEATQERDNELDERLIRGVLVRLGYDGALAPRVMPITRAAFRQPGIVRLYPEVVDVLRSLRARGYALGIISNWNWDLPELVQLTGLGEYFDVVVASARAGCGKPHPRIFRQALSALGGVPDRAVHIGDSFRSDVVGARGIGMSALWLDRAGCGGHPDCPTIRDLTEVLPLLDG